MVTTGDTRWHLVVIQYGPDYRVIARLGYFTDTPEADVAAGKAIIESLTVGHLPLD